MDQNLPLVYRRFLDRELTLEEAVAVLSAEAKSGVAAPGTLALSEHDLLALAETDRQRVGELWVEVVGPIDLAFANGELTVEVAARQLAPFTARNTFFGLDSSSPDGSPWSPEAIARFRELCTRVSELTRESMAPQSILEFISLEPMHETSWNPACSFCGAVPPAELVRAGGRDYWICAQCVEEPVIEDRVADGAVCTFCEKPTLASVGRTVVAARRGAMLCASCVVICALVLAESRTRNL